MSRDTRTANFVSLFFSQSPHYYRFRPVAVDTVIADFHIISRYINYFWYCIIWTECYHSPIILIAEHITMVSKRSIPSIFQFFPCIQCYFSLILFIIIITLFLLIMIPINKLTNSPYLNHLFAYK